LLSEGDEEVKPDQGDEPEKWKKFEFKTGLEKATVHHSFHFGLQLLIFLVRWLWAQAQADDRPLQTDTLGSRSLEIRDTRLLPL
jgi:hypothetical protein